MGCRSIFKIHGSRDIKHLAILGFSKTVFTTKLLIKHKRQKNHENFVKSFPENYIKNHLAKFLQDRIKL